MSGSFRTYENVLQCMGPKPKLTKGDFLVPNPPAEKLSSVAWAHTTSSSAPSILYASGWDGSVRLWNVSESNANAVSFQPLTMFSSSGSPAPPNSPALPIFHTSAALSPSGVDVFYTRADASIHHALVAPDGNVQQRQLSCFPRIPSASGAPAGGAHANPLFDHSQSTAWVEPLHLVFAGTWAGKLYAWDIRAPNGAAGNAAPSVEFHTPDLAPVQAMDLDVASATHPGQLGVVLSPRSIHVLDLRARQLLTVPTPIEPYHAAKHQLRSVVRLREDIGFAAGSMDGRLLVQVYEPMIYQRAGMNPPSALTTHATTQIKSYSFRAHRENGDGLDVFAVNAVTVHPHTQALVSGGSNGSISYWNRFTKERICDTQFPRYLPVTSLAFNPVRASLLAYGLSYDWSMGSQYFDPVARPPAVVVKLVTRELVHTGK